MKKEVIRVEPLSTYLEKWKAPTSAVTRSGDTIYVSGFPPFDPETGNVVEAPIERQTELVLEQMKLCLETAGSSLENVLKCNVYYTSVEKFASVARFAVTVSPFGRARRPFPHDQRQEQDYEREREQDSERRQDGRESRAVDSIAHEGAQETEGRADS